MFLAALPSRDINSSQVPQYFNPLSANFPLLPPFFSLTSSCCLDISDVELIFSIVVCLTPLTIQYVSFIPFFVLYVFSFILNTFSLTPSHWEQHFVVLYSSIIVTGNLFLHLSSNPLCGTPIFFDTEGFHYPFPYPMKTSSFRLFPCIVEKKESIVLYLNI